MTVCRRSPARGVSRPPYVPQTLSPFAVIVLEGAGSPLIFDRPYSRVLASNGAAACVFGAESGCRTLCVFLVTLAGPHHPTL